MKIKATLLLFLFACSISVLAQTFATLPYATSFESGSLDASWAVIEEGAPSANRTRVEVTNAYTAYHGSYDLNMDNIGSNSNRTGQAWLHLDLTGETEVTMSFYYKDYADENNTGYLNGDGIYFSDDSGSTFKKYYIAPESYASFQWHRISIDIDQFCADSGLSLNDSFIVKFQQRDNLSIDESQAGQATPASDGIAIDSLYIRAGGPLTSGAISGSDTICGGSGTNIVISNLLSPTEGDNDYSYSWQTSTNGFTWSTYAAPNLDSLVIAGPLSSGYYWVRRGVTSATSGEGPIYTTPVLIVIPTVPTVAVYGLSPTYCSNEDSVMLSTSPVGGTLTDITTGGGGALNGLYFRPGSAVADSLGATNEIEYTYTDSYNCTYSDTVSTTIYQAPIVNFDAVGTYPETQTTAVVLDSLINTTWPGTFTISGSGSAKNASNEYIFTPSASGGPGVKTLTCVFTSEPASGSCSVTVTSDAIVTGTSTGTILTRTSFCETEAPYSQAVGTPSSPGFNYPGNYCGSLSGPYLLSHSVGGTGISWNGSVATFDPSVPTSSVVTIYNSATYVYYYYYWIDLGWLGQYCWGFGSQTVVNTIYQDVTIFSEPQITVSVPKNQYCEYESPVSIVTKNSGVTIAADSLFLDGTYFAGSTFNPGAVSIGTHVITAKYKQNTCVAYAYDTVNVFSAPTVSYSGLATNYCDNENRDLLTLSPSGGVFTGSINGVTTIGANTFFYPDSAGTGSHNITYTYTDGNGCYASDVHSTQVYASPNLSISGVNAQALYCTDASPASLQGQNNSVNFGFGSFSGPSVTDGGNNGTGTFDPTTLPIDSSYNIVYTYTDGNGCKDSSIKSVQVVSLPPVNFYGLDSQYCSSDGIVVLTGSEAAGVFSGTGVTGSTFDPGVSTGLHNITFTFTDGNGCTNDTTKQTIVDTLPVVTFAGLPAEICKNGNPVTLTGNFTNGSYYNTTLSGLDSVGQGVAVFDPNNNAITVGNTYTVIYTYQNGNGCTSTFTDNVLINAIPPVSFSGLANLYCEDASTINLTGNWAPFGQQGSFTGTGITDLGTDTATFNPTIPTANNWYRVYYTYVDANGCSDTDSQNVFVKPLPTVSFGGLDTSYCESDGIDPLTESFSPTGGTGGFSGPGMSGVIFDPGAAGIGTKTITYSYTDADGCFNSYSDNTIVHALPTVTISGVDTSTVGVVAAYCQDPNIPVDTIYGNQVGGSWADAYYSSSNDTAILDATTRGTGSHIVVYQYTDVNGCWNADTLTYVVNPLPVPDFNTLDPIYCEYDGMVNLSGSINADHPYSRLNSYYFGVGVSNTTANNSTFDPTVVPIATAGGWSIDSIYFVFEDVNGCLDTVMKTTEVHGRPVINVSMADSTMCTDDPSAPITNIHPSGAGTEVFTIFPSATSLGGNTFNPSNASIGINTLIYDYIDQYGCQNWDTTEIVVYPKPSVNFYLGSFCNNDSVSLFDSSFIINSFAVGTNNDSIVGWDWNFGDNFSQNANTDSTENPKHKFTFATSYPIHLQVTTREGCVNDTTRTELIGEPPAAKFEWDNVCFGEILQFTDLSTAQGVDPIDTWVWSFGDGNSLNNNTGGHIGTDVVTAVDNNGGITGGTYKNPNHQYQVLNSYYVSLALSTGSGCKDTTVKLLNIRPVIDSYPYTEDFEIDNGGWFAGGLTDTLVDVYSWELGLPNGNPNGGIYDPSTNAWVTNLDGDYSNNEQSYVDGPCFDFTNLTRPMIIMDIWSDMIEGGDGAVLQYSLDNGLNWTTIGEIGDGINWYNTTSISGNPGNQAINQVGWSYEDTMWVEARHDLDMLIGEPQVRLRIAFGSDGASANDGMAFDNVRIQERSRIALLEYFTNSSDANSVQDDDYIDNLIFDNKKDVVDIQYHTEFPGNDEMNNHNPADPSARALFYGAFNIGRGILNGNQYNGVSSSLTDNHIKLQMLKDSPYGLTIGADISNGVITTTSYLTARKNITDADVTVHFAVVEKQITDLVGANGDVEFRSVLKKMMPSASGTLVNRSFLAGDTIGFTQSWTMENVFDVDNINVVAFVQDNETDEVYQVSTTDTSAVPPVVVPPLGEELITLNEELKMKLFPNPTNGSITLLFNQLIDAPVIQFVDMSGKILDNFSFIDRLEYVNFELNYPSGMYYVQVKSEDKVITQKLVITK